MLRRVIPACHAATVGLCAFAATAQPCEPHWSDEFWASAPHGDVRALAVHDEGVGPTLYMGTAGPYCGVSSWDRTKLRLLGSVSGTASSYNTTGVYALAVQDSAAGGVVHAAGNFTEIDGVAALSAARLTENGWEPLGAGVDGLVRALAIFDDGGGPALYAGGLFQVAGGGPASAIAKWDGTAWSALGTGMAGGATAASFAGFPMVYALTVFDDGGGPALYAGGNFSQAGGSDAMAIARWNGSAWEQVGAGLAWLGDQQGVVTALTTLAGTQGPSLYAAGRVSFGPQSPYPVVARWDGVSWQPHGSPHWIPATSIAAASSWGTPTLYLGTLGTEVLRLDDQKWVTIGTTPTSLPVRALVSFDDGGGNHLIAGGSFTSLDGIRYLARWDSKQWWILPRGGSVQEIRRFKVLDLGNGPSLYALGSHSIGSYTGEPVARFDDPGWVTLGPTSGLSSTVYDAEVFDDGTGRALYVAGSKVYKLAGSEWELVGGTTAGFTNHVNTLKAFDDGSGPRLFVGGSFPYGVRAWDGAAWTTPGGGFLPLYGSGDGPQEFEVFNDGSGPRLYLALSTALCKWDGSSWLDVQGPYVGGIRDLEIHDDGTGHAMYAARGAAGSSVVKFDGASWSVIAAETVPNIPIALTSFNDGLGPSLFVTGYFTSIDGVPANKIARWRSGRWSALGSGLGGGNPANVTGTAVIGFDGPHPSLWVGGTFQTAGGLSSSNIARWFTCACYPDCNTDTFLSAADFGCFQTRFVAADPYADCTSDGALTIADFGCFQTKFVAGCP